MFLPYFYLIDSFSMCSRCSCSSFVLLHDVVFCERSLCFVLVKYDGRFGNTLGTAFGFNLGFITEPNIFFLLSFVSLYRSVVSSDGTKCCSHKPQFSGWQPIFSRNLFLPMFFKTINCNFFIFFGAFVTCFVSRCYTRSSHLKQIYSLPITK